MKMMKTQKYRNPIPTADIIIKTSGGIVLIRRKNPPFGWAIPGGYIEYEESAERAAVREAKEETNLDVKLEKLFHVYSDPKRDPRQHNIAIVFVANAKGKPEARDDAKGVKTFKRKEIPKKMAFDHRLILEDYFNKKY